MRAFGLTRLTCLAALAALAICTGGLAGAQALVQPDAGASAPAPSSAAASAANPHQRGGRPAVRPALGPVNLNTASRAELMKLPGIGEAEARRIVDGRPYKSKADLVTRNVLTLVAYDRLKRQVVVDHRKAARPQPGRPAARAAASKPTS